MEYIFGYHQECENLRTKDNIHTNLTGFQQIIQEYPDQIITDSFRIIRKYHSAEDAEGNCYDWYEIDQHYQIQDKTLPLIESQEKCNSIIGGIKTYREYNPGEFISVDGKLYVVTLTIPAGGYLALGTNVRETTIIDELSSLNN